MSRELHMGHPPKMFVAPLHSWFITCIKVGAQQLRTSPKDIIGMFFTVLDPLLQDLEWRDLSLDTAVLTIPFRVLFLQIHHLKWQSLWNGLDSCFYPELSLRNTFSSGDIWKLTAGLALYFRAMSNTWTKTKREGIWGGNFAPRLSGSRANYATQLFP